MREQLLTTIEAAQILRCAPDNVRRLARDGQLPVETTVGHGQRLFSRVSVERFARERTERKTGATVPPEAA